MIIVQAKAIPKDETSKNKIIEAAANLIEKSKLENGNINYNLYSNVQEDTLLFVEQWENLDILKAHLQTEHNPFVILIFDIPQPHSTLGIKTSSAPLK